MPNNGEETHAPALGSVSQESREMMRAFEKKFLNEEFYFGNGLSARSGLFDLGNNCFLRLYAVKTEQGGLGPEKFMASLYRADETGLLQDVEYDGLSESFRYKGRAIPKLTTFEAVRNLISTTMALPQKTTLRGRVVNKLIGGAFAPEMHDARPHGHGPVHKIMSGLPFLEPN